ncbi:MAG: GNAT family N-acetyltransferase [Thermomicrobiales bacterium]
MSDDRRAPLKVGAAQSGRVSFSLEPLDGRNFAFRYNVYARTIKPYIDALLGWDEAQHVANLRADLEQGPPLSIIVVGGERVGIVQIVETPDEISLWKIAILPEYQGRGIGTAIVQSLIARSQAAQKPVRLFVFQANRGARRLYERLGFTVVSETDQDIEMAFTPRQVPARG